jgi:hypothetical protein
LRERFDATTGLVVIGAVLLLVSLFIDWYRPGGNAWSVFETLDLLLAGAAICALLATVPRFDGLARALPVIALAAFAVVLVQAIDPPPVAADADRATGLWLGLAATALMAIGSLLAAASISITVDVRGRERRRRSAAIDAREGGRDDGAEEEAEAPTRAARRFGRREGSLFDAEAPRAREEAAPGAVEAASPAEDPQRTQALDPVADTSDDA